MFGRTYITTIKDLVTILSGPSLV